MEVHIKDLKTSLGLVIFTMDMNNCIFQESMTTPRISSHGYVQYAKFQYINYILMCNKYVRIFYSGIHCDQAQYIHYFSDFIKSSLILGGMQLLLLCVSFH